MSERFVTPNTPAAERPQSPEQMERIPALATEAARKLTALADTILGYETRERTQLVSDVPSENYRALRAGSPQYRTPEEEAAALEYEATQKVFFDSVQPQLIALGKLGIVEFYDKRLRYRELYDTATQPPRFVALFPPNFTDPLQEVNVSAVLKELHPNRTEAEMKALLASIHPLINEYNSLIATEAEDGQNRYEEPNPEDIELIESVLASIPENDVVICSRVTSNTHDEYKIRDSVKRKLDGLGSFISDLTKFTDITTDADRTKYPKFWQLKANHKRILDVIGRFDGKSTVTPGTYTAPLAHPTV